MPVLILSCDEQEARNIFNDWLQEPARFINCDVEYEIAPVQSGEQERTWLSVTCKPTLRVRNRAIIFMGACLLPFFLLILFMPSFLIWAGRLMPSNPSRALLLFIGFLLLLLITLLSPQYTLGLLSRFCSREEKYLIASFTQRGVHYNILNPGDHWTWFRDDSFAILIGTAVFAGSYLLTAFNAWGLLQVFAPLLLFLPVALTLFLIRTIVYKPLDTVSHLPLFWKIKVTELADVDEAFYFPIVLYVLLVVVGHVTLFIAFGSVNMHNYSFPMAIKFFTAFNESAFFSCADNCNVERFNEILTTYIGLSYPYLQYAIYLEWAIGVLLFLACFRLITSVFNVEKWETLWEGLKWQPSLLPEDIVSQATNPLVHGGLFLEWLLTGFFFRIFGLIVGLVILLMILGMPPTWIPWQWLIPFIWYRVSFQAILGTVVGSIIANFLLLLVVSPLLLWLLLWIVSLLSACKQFFSLIHSRNSNRDDKVQAVMNDLCKTLHISQPIVRVVRDAATSPTTSFLLPTARFSIIRLPIGVVTKLTQNQLRLVLAHELGHVTKHAWRLWSLQLLSRLSLNGPGYLTLFLDYWSMEMEADAFAAKVTGDSRGLITLLQEDIATSLLLEQPVDDESINGWKAKKIPSRLIRYRWIGRLVKIYDIYMGEILWGTFHPPVEARVKNLYNIEKESNEKIAKEESTASTPQHIEKIKKLDPILALLPRWQVITVLPNFYAGIFSSLRRENPDQQKSLVLRIRAITTMVPLIFVWIFFIERDRRGMLTQQVLKVFEFAAEEAIDFQHNYIGTEHLLLGLLRCDDSGTVRILKQFGVKIEKVRHAVEFLIDDGDTPNPPDLSWTPQAERSLELAMEEAARLHSFPLDTEHLLLGILRDDDNLADILKSFNIDLEAMREATLASLREKKTDAQKRSNNR